MQFAMAEIIGAKRQQKSSEGAVRVPKAVKRSDQSTKQKKTSSHAETREDVRERFAGKVLAANRLHKFEKSYLVPGVGTAGAAVVAACWSRLSEYFFPEKKTLVNDFEPSSSLLVE